MKRKIEITMHGLFICAAAPFAWLYVSNLAFYLSNPEVLLEREAYREAGVVFTILPYFLATLLTGATIAAYFFISGPKKTRFRVLVLSATYALALGLHPSFPWNTYSRLVWDAGTTIVMLTVPTIFIVQLLLNRPTFNSSVNTDEVQASRRLP